MADDYVPQSDFPKPAAPAPQRPRFILDDPDAPRFESAILQWLHQQNTAAGQGRVRRYEDTPAASTSGMSAFAAAAEGMGGAGHAVARALDRPVVEGTVGPVTDITAASVHPGTTELTQSERTLRVFNRLGRIARGTVTEGTLFHSGVQNLIASGEMSPPATREEEIVDFVAPMLIGMGVITATTMGVGALGAFGAAAAPVVAGLAGTARAGEAALTAAQILGRPLGTGLGAQLAARIPGIAGLTRATAGTVTPAVIGEALTGVGIDIGFGVGFGAAEAGMTREMGTPVSDEEALAMMRNFALASGALGVAFRTRVGWRTGKGFLSMARRTPLLIEPGASVEGFTAVPTRVGTKWRDPATGRFASGPSQSSIHAAEAERLHKMQAVAAGEPGAEAARARLAATDPTNPETMPPDIVPQEQDVARLLATRYYLGTLSRRTRGPEAQWVRPRLALEAERNQLLEVINDASVPKEERVSAAALVQALDYRLGESTGTAPGQLPFELDMAALAVTRAVKPRLGRDILLRAGAEMRGTGQPELGQRIAELADLQLPETAYAAVRKRLGASDRALSRGFKRGDQALTPDGDIVMLLDTPHYGVTTVRSRMKPGMPRGVATVDELIPIPSVGKTVELRDGRFVKIESLNESKLTFSGQVVGALKAQRAATDIPITDIKGTIHPPLEQIRARAVLERMKNGSELEAARAGAGEDVVPIAPTEGITATGEPVVISAVSKTTAEVRPKGGKTRTVKRESVRRSTRTKPPAPEPAVTVPETAGFIRPSGENLDIGNVPHPRAAEELLGTTFDKALASGNVRYRAYRDELSIELPWSGGLTEAQRIELRRVFAATKKAADKPVEVIIDPSLDIGYASTQTEFNTMLRAAEEAGRKATITRAAPEALVPSAPAATEWADFAAQPGAAGAAPEPVAEVAAARRATRATRARQAPAATPRPEIVDFAPGTIPDEGHRILYWPVFADQAEAFERAWASGADLAPYAELRTHVVPPLGSDARFRLYAVELPAGALSRKLYTPAATRMVNELGWAEGKKLSKLEGDWRYSSPVNAPAEVLGQGRLYRIADELHAASQRPWSLVGPMTQAERTAYLRNLLTMNEHVDTEYAQAAAAVRAAQEQTITAVEAGDAVAAMAGEEAQTAALLDAASQAQRLTTTDVLARLSAAPDAPLDAVGLARRSFRDNGLTPETEATWINIIDGLEPRPSEYAGESGWRLALLHESERGQRLFVSKVAVPELAGEGVDLIPGTRNRFQIVPVDKGGHIIREAMAVVDTPGEVAAYVTREGYIPSETLLPPEAGYSARDGRVGTITFTNRGSYAARVEQNLRQEKLVGKPGVDRTMELTTELPTQAQLEQRVAANKVLARMGVVAKDESGGSSFILEEVKEFPTLREAEEWFRKQYRLERVSEAGAINDAVVTRFSNLPPLAELRGDKVALGEVEAQLRHLLVESVQRHRAISPELNTYATELGDLFYESWGRPAFNRQLRDLLDIPTVDDIGPHLSHSVLDEADLRSGVLRIEGKEGVYEAEELTRILDAGTQTIHITAESTNRALKHQGKLYGRLTAYAMPRHETAESAASIQLAQNLQTKWTGAHLDAQKTLNTDPGAINRTLGTHTPSGKVVEIIDVPLESPEVRIRFPDTGEELIVNKSLVEPASAPGLPTEPVRDGRYMSLVRAFPETGMGTVERNLGLAGVTDRNILYNGWLERSRALLDDIHFGKGRPFSAPKESVLDLFELWRRGAEMEAREVRVARTQYEATLTGKRIGAPWDVQRAEMPVRTRTAADLKAEAQEAAAQSVLDRLGPATEEGAPAPLAAWETAEIRVPSGRVSSKSLWVAQRNLGKSMQEAVLQAIREKNPALEGPFRRAVYSYVKKQLGDHPFAELQAKAMSGTLLPNQEALLRAWAKDAQLSPNVPLGRIVVEMASRKFFDPYAAEVAVSLRKDAGFWRWTKEVEDQGGGFPPGVVSGLDPFTTPVNIKMRRVGGYASRDIPFRRSLGIPWKTLRRHPVTRLMDDVLAVAVEDERKLLDAGRMVWKDIQDHGYTNDDMLAMRSALGTHGTWTEAAAAGVSSKLQYGFNTLRNWYDERLDDVVRYFLRRKIDLAFFNPGDDAHAAFVRKQGIDPATVRDGAFLSSPNPDRWARKPINASGEVPSGLSEDQITKILELRRWRRAGNQGPFEPGDVDFFRNVYTPERLEEVVDWWANYGIRNYWPLVHEGNLVVLDEAGKVLGWATNLPDAVEGIQGLIKKGVLRTQNGMLIDNVRIEQNTPIVDDILVSYVPTSDWKQVGREMARHETFSPDDIRGMLMRPESGTPGYVRPPGLVHAKMREARLDPLIINPAREFGIYTGRVARMNYRFKVMEANRILENTQLDAALSKFHGTRRLHGVGDEGFPTLLSYSRDHISTALGERGMAEDMLDSVRGLIQAYATRGPALWVQKQASERLGIGGPVPVPTKDIFNRQYWQRAYTARMASSDIVKFQSRWRLAGSVGSAVANATQFWTTTTARLMGHGLNEAEAVALAFSSWKDGINLWRIREFGGKVPKRLDEFVSMIDEMGISLLPTKYEVGTRGATLGATANRPSRLGKSSFEYHSDLFWHYAMLGFDGAERVNRYSTAIAALKLARGPAMNLDRGAAIAFARNMVRETQFLYDELAIPHAITAMGPLGRVLFQFKPFLFNMMSFEKDLMVRAILDRDRASISQLATHLGALGAFGGVAGLSMNPIIEAATVPLKWATGIDLSPDRMAATRRQRRREMMSPEERFSDTMHYGWDDVLFYGLPGLAGLSMGRRVGIAGQDLMLGSGGATVLGPHLAMYWSAFQAAKQVAQLEGTGAAQIGAIAGAALPSLIPSKLVQATFSIPGSRLISAVALGEIASARSPTSLKDVFEGTREGRQFVSQVQPTAVRNILRATRGWSAMPEGMRDVVTQPGSTLLPEGAPDRLRRFVDSFGLTVDGTVRDLDGKPTYIPIENGTQEALYLLLGLPSARQQEASAAVGMMTAGSQGDAATMRAFVDRVARAYVEVDQGDGLMEDVFKALHDAQRLGLHIDETSVKRRIEAITQERLETVYRRQPRRSR